MPLPAELEVEIAKHPPHVADVMRAYPPNRCYRERLRTRGHYWIRSYAEHTDLKNGPSVTLTLIHGRDSFLPGMPVRGVTTDELVVCDCKQWEAASDDQLYWMREHLACLELARQGAVRPHEEVSPALHELHEKYIALHRAASTLENNVRLMLEEPKAIVDREVLGRICGETKTLLDLLPPEKVR